MKRKFCCDASARMYIDHYAQSGRGGIPIFVGYRGQRGHGLGSILSGFFRSALPIIKRGLGIFGREALRTGAKIATDVADGRNLGDAAKHRISERINEIVPGVFPQSGSGYRLRRRKRSSSSASLGRSKKRRTTRRRRGRKSKSQRRRRRRTTFSKKRRTGKRNSKLSDIFA